MRSKPARAAAAGRPTAEIVSDRFDLRPAERDQAIPHGVLPRAGLRTNSACNGMTRSALGDLSLRTAITLTLPAIVAFGRGSPRLFENRRRPRTPRVHFQELLVP